MAVFIINNTIRVVSDYLDVDTVKYEFYYPVETPTPVLSGHISAGQLREVHYRAYDGFLIKGALKLTVQAMESILNGNLYYGFYENLALQHHFEGTLALFHEALPLPPDRDDDDTDDFPPLVAVDAPLFPYINIQPWPDDAPADGKLSFFSFDPAHTGAGSLYSLLAGLAPQKDRLAMEQLCLQFLQNEAPFTGQYYGSLKDVPPPFDRFPAIYDEWVKAEVFDRHDDLAPARLSASWQSTTDQLWQNYFALAVVPGFNEPFAMAVNKILLVCNLLEKIYGVQPPAELTAHETRELLEATVILPPLIFPLPPYPATTAPARPTSWIAPYAIGQLKMSRYRLLRYQPGEIAAIQNVMKGEQKKITQRQLNSSSEQLSENTANTNDTASQYRQMSNDLLLEAKKTLAGLTQTTTYNNFTTTYGPPTQAVLNGSWSVTQQPNSDERQAGSGFVNRVLNSTLSRISENISRIRAYSKYSENEAVTSSIFDNRNGNGHFRGIYRWLNKIYRITVENYGYRFLLELSIDHPAQDYIQSQQALNATDLQKPLSPAELGIAAFTDITVSNYTQLLSYYQVETILLPPDAATYATVMLSPGETEKYAAIPEHYFAMSAVVTGIIAGNAPVQAVNGIAGSALFQLTDKVHTQNLDMDGERGQLAVSVIGPNTPAEPPYQPNDFIINVKIKCGVTEEKMNEWKARIYRQINESYQQRLSLYVNTLSRLAGEDEQSNPELLRNTERAALRRRCAALLLQVFFTKVGNAPGDQEPATFQVNEPRYYQFLQDALEWDEMAWFFDDSPSVYSYALQGRDDSLRPFLQAQRARVLLPVRPLFNFQVLYYLSSGMLWQAPYPFVPVNKTDTAIAAHLKAAHHRPPYTKTESSWEIALPTAMQVVQDSSQLPEFSTPHTS
jgi:hypothetical protein